MALWRLYYHLVWATKERRPLLIPEIEETVYGYIIGKSDALGAIVHAIGGVEDHMHVVVSIPPKLAIADYVKSVKGSSAHHVNHGPFRNRVTLRWQGGYGVFSMGSKQVTDAIGYVRNQKEHHRRGTLIDMLERIEDDDNGPALWDGGDGIRHIPSNSGSVGDGKDSEEDED